MNAPEIATEPDRVPLPTVRAAMFVVLAMLGISTVTVWLLTGLSPRGGGRSDVVPSLEPPDDPFEVTTEHERHRSTQRARLVRWEWADSAHTRVRLPIAAAIDRYLGASR
jgi:hypothetical protein